MSADSTTVTKAGGFSEEALEELSWSRNEPAWLRQLRMDAWRTWERTPMPSRKDEEWRRTDISMLDLGRAIPFFDQDGHVDKMDDLPSEVRSLLTDGTSMAGVRVHRNSSTAFTQLSDELAAKGVVLTDMNTAVREHGNLVQRYIGSQITPSDGKFQALHAAFWSGGTFMYVPRTVELQAPVHAVTWADAQGISVMPHTLIVLEPGARLSFVDDHASPEGRSPALVNGAVELVIGEGARLDYVSIQRWGTSVFAFGTQRASVGRDAHLTSLSVVLGSKLTKSWIDSLLKEPGAYVQMVGIMFANGKQRFHHHTLQDHQAPNTTSDLLFKAALTDEARSEYSGLIRVHKDAQKTDAYQANRNLSLSEHARADSMPKLEIEANDVRCTHGATVGPIDEEQIFYMMSRGLPRPVAERMIVEGFFEQVMEKIPIEEVRATVRGAVAAKLSER
jgi:Fe-S cluster assembly protein SufD